MTAVARKPGARRMPALSALLLAGLLAGPPALAQQSGGALDFGGIRHDSSEPIEINADTLEVDQATGIARFSGDVIVSQGDLKLTAGAVEARYAAGSGDEEGRLAALHATEKVLITAGPATAQSDQASYDVEGRQIIMTGNVMLTQAGNTIAGQRLTIDTASGTGRMEGRVRTVLRPGSAP